MTGPRGPDTLQRQQHRQPRAVRQHARSLVAAVVFTAQKPAVELRRKLAILADAAKYDASCASSGSRRKTPAGGLGNGEGMGICHSYTPDGRCVSLLKILLTNECIYDCQYCINRSTSSAPRARFSPEEVVRLTLEFYRRNYIEGLFLSSGVLRSPDATMEQLIAVARSLREDHRFGGYIHLKATPGVSAGLLAEAGRHADRLSVNVACRAWLRRDRGRAPRRDRLPRLDRRAQLPRPALQRDPRPRPRAHDSLGARLAGHAPPRRRPAHHRRRRPRPGPRRVAGRPPSGSQRAATNHSHIAPARFRARPRR